MDKQGGGDDFEFKPLTEGLGFHKKSIDLRDDTLKSMKSQKAGVSSGGTGPFRPETSSISDPWKPSLKNHSIIQSEKNTGQKNSSAQGASSISASAPLTFNPSGAQTPNFGLPSFGLSQSPMAKAGMPTFAGPGETNSLQQHLTQQHHQREQQQAFQLEPIAVSWSAAIFDSAMVAGLGLLFSAVVFALTKIDLNDLVEMLKTEGGAQIATFVLFVAVFEIYCVSCRSFFGKTLGEWAFDCRLGTDKAQQSLMYPLRVAWRSLVVALTGFITLPLISTIVGRDVSGIISGVSLFSERR